MKNIREEIKVEVNYRNTHINAITHRVDKYTRAKYINILNEEVLIKDILEYCGEDDKEISQKYLKELEKLQQEKKILANKIKELNKNIEMEK